MRLNRQEQLRSIHHQLEHWQHNLAAASPTKPKHSTSNSRNSTTTNSTRCGMRSAKAMNKSSPAAINSAIDDEDSKNASRWRDAGVATWEDATVIVTLRVSLAVWASWSRSCL